MRRLESTCSATTEEASSSTSRRRRSMIHNTGEAARGPTSTTTAIPISAWRTSGPRGSTGTTAAARSSMWPQAPCWHTDTAGESPGATTTTTGTWIFTLPRRSAPSADCIETRATDRSRRSRPRSCSNTASEPSGATTTMTETWTSISGMPPPASRTCWPATTAAARSATLPTPRWPTPTPRSGSAGATTTATAISTSTWPTAREDPTDC